MDLVTAFKSEVFRPIVTLVVPGAVAVGPWIIITGYCVPAVRIFWNEHPSAFVAIVTIYIIAAGLILENIGAEIEYRWDIIINRNDAENEPTWYKYLKLELNDELIGQRYLRIVLTWMKFELAMAPALIFLWGGLLWVSIIYSVWSVGDFIKLSIFILGLATYLVYSSYESAKNLSKIRKLIVEAVEAKPLVNKSKSAPLKAEA